MAVSEAQLADILANLAGTPATPTPAAAPATPRAGTPTCRALGCTERLDPALVDRDDNTGLHLMCQESIQPAPSPDPAAAPCDDLFCKGTDHDCGHSAVAHFKPASTAHQYPREEAAPAEPASTVAELRTLLINHDASSARSQQQSIGPSEIGVPCDRRLGYRLHSTPERVDTRVPWAPIQGTAVHTYLADLLVAHNTLLGRQRWIVEERVWPDEHIHGSGDAYDTDTDCVVDWKVIGANSLAKYRKQVRPEYRIQGHLYGLGHERAGRPVKWVRLVYLARDHDYEKSYEWTEPYNRTLAEQALERVYTTVTLLQTLNVDTTPAMWGAVPATPTPDCTWCPYFRPGRPADETGCPGDVNANQRRVDKFTDGLVPTKTPTP